MENKNFLEEQNSRLRFAVSSLLLDLTPIKNITMRLLVAEQNRKKQKKMQNLYMKLGF